MNPISSQQLELYWKKISRRLDDFEIRQRLRLLTRQGRKRALLLFLALLFIVYCFYPSSSVPDSSHYRGCLEDRLHHWKLRYQDSSVGIDDWSVKFAGNGFIGIGNHNDLNFRENDSRVLSLSSLFHPLVRLSFPEASSLQTASITDFEKGQWIVITCYDVNGECACVEETVYAHRTQKSLLIQEIKIINPTTNSLQVKLNRPNSDGWSNNKSSPNSVQSRQFSSTTGNTVMAVVCSSAPQEITMTQKREESLSFVCAAGMKYALKEQDVKSMKTEVEIEVVKEFQKAKKIGGAALEKKHWDAWTKLNSISFYLSSSKAPDVLNGIQINATRYMLMSNTRALDLEESENDLKKAHHFAFNRSFHVQCYVGHSSLLYPSRLWQRWDTTDDITRIADVWLLTLMKKGCSELVVAGSQGVAQAFVMSLLAASFDQSHLEIGIDPADLHRQMRVQNLPIQGSTKASINVNLHLDDGNVPCMLISSTSELFVCSAGCVDDPLPLGIQPVKLPVKVTKPLTSILYVSNSRKHLTQLRSTIHVSEVNHALAHENEVIALHEHGHALGGLPLAFWVLLAILLIAFHVFLVKLLWTEWRKGDTTPYNPYLRSRYSYVRSH